MGTPFPCHFFQLKKNFDTMWKTKANPLHAYLPNVMSTFDSDRISQSELDDRHPHHNMNAQLLGDAGTLLQLAKDIPQFTADFVHADYTRTANDIYTAVLLFMLCGTPFIDLTSPTYATLKDDLLTAPNIFAQAQQKLQCTTTNVTQSAALSDFAQVLKMLVSKKYGPLIAALLASPKKLLALIQKNAHDIEAKMWHWHVAGAGSDMLTRIKTYRGPDNIIMQKVMAAISFISQVTHEYEKRCCANATTQAFDPVDRTLITGITSQTTGGWSFSFVGGAHQSILASELQKHGFRPLYGISADDITHRRAPLSDDLAGLRAHVENMKAFIESVEGQPAINLAAKLATIASIVTAKLGAGCDDNKPTADAREKHEIGADAEQSAAKRARTAH